MEKRCIVFVVIGSFVILSLVIVFFIIYLGHSPCTSKECVQTASELLTHIDASADPCSDFYEFTCGNFLRVLGEHDSKDLTYYMKNTKTNKIRQMLEAPAAADDTDILYKIKSLYRACINDTFIDEHGLVPIKGILDDIGGWPLLERGNWRENIFDWKNATYNLRKIGIEFNVFIIIEVGINRYEPTRHILEVRPGNHTSIEIAEENKNAYLEFMVEVALHFGADKNRAEQDSRGVIEFQSQLKRFASKSSRSRGKDMYGMAYGNYFNPKIVSQMQYDFPRIPWVEYINGVIYPSGTVTQDEVVNMVDPEYIKKFLEVLHKTPKRVLANFISWHIIRNHMAYLPDNLRRIEEKYVSGVEMRKSRPRRDICTDIILKKLPQGVETSYVRKHVKDGAKRRVKEIIAHIKKEFNKVMEKLDWLDPDAKVVAREKLASTKDYIAHTQEASSKRKLDLIYDEIVIGDLLATVLHISLLNLNFKYQKLTEPVAEEEVRNELKYSVKENAIIIPSFYLQGLFFNEYRPQYLNYGALGTIVAYQLSNLFLEGRHYDLHGNRREWSTSQSLYNYDSRARCITEQYKQFYIPGLGRNVNATLSQEDDVAIHFGKNIAYEAYRAWSENHDTEQRLPGLSYTPRQLFWISSAMYECSQRSQRELVDEILRNRRSISRYRAIGPLRNIPDFAIDFSCPPGTYMNPDEKCLLW